MSSVDLSATLLDSRADSVASVSAGFDAAEGDHLGGCHVSPAGYGHMTHMLSCLANGRLVVALEVSCPDGGLTTINAKLFLKQGGYNIDSIAASSLECVKVLLGEIPPQMPSMRASEEATEAVHEVQLIQSRWWKSIQPTSMSKEGEFVLQIPQDNKLMTLQKWPALVLSFRSLRFLRLIAPIISGTSTSYTMCRFRCQPYKTLSRISSCLRESWPCPCLQ